ncbi:hypothetical protein [Tateyamaria sp. SN6-1]|uniref:hypothetical protein n=1 Tax=Tateyamaria sp. SN6-1 TaxID=3092148 RepID=UPI0039F450FA
MKIKRDTEDQLILEHTPWLISIMLVVMMVTSVGMGGMFALMGLSEGIAIFTIMGLAAPVVGIAMCTFAMRIFVKRTQVILDRGPNTLTVRTRGMQGYDEIIHDLSHLSHAILETSRSNEGQQMTRPAIVLTGGMSEGTHPLVTSFVSGFGPKKAVDAINRWANRAPG